jgi:uncharacterized repeat protein (TIGR03803 family)
LHKFKFFEDGRNPYGKLIVGRDGFLYGVTQDGGPQWPETRGGIFRMTLDGAVTVVHSFAGVGYPVVGMVQGPDGTFYGATGIAVWAYTPD